VSKVWHCQNPTKAAISASTRPASGGCRVSGKIRPLLFKKLIARTLGTTSTPSPVAAPTEVVALRSMSTYRALWHLAGRGLDINTVIDVGASNGMWSAVCEKHYPACHYLLVEAQEAHAQAVKAYCAARPKTQYVLAVAGDECGQIYCDGTDLFGYNPSGQPQQVTLEGNNRSTRNQK
jgi:hypothetical protein